jgi:inhibitor of KinA sporulation pathway (predicted exonuclease)
MASWAPKKATMASVVGTKSPPPAKLATSTLNGATTPSPASSSTTTTTTTTTTPTSSESKDSFVGGAGIEGIDTTEFSASDVAQPFAYYCVIDFECTCEENNRDNYPHEIIEWPAVLIDASTNQVVDTFHVYVTPTQNPKLTPFCTQLTGIQQSQVSGDESTAVPLAATLEQFHQWLVSHKLVPLSSYAPDASPKSSELRRSVAEASTVATRGNVAFVTDGPWDLNHFLFTECTRKAIRRPKYLDQWVNIR